MTKMTTMMTTTMNDDEEKAMSDYDDDKNAKKWNARKDCGKEENQ